jgi:cell shape-determining protein MreD
MKKDNKNSLSPIRRRETGGERGHKYSLLERLRGWRLGISLDAETIMKGVVCALLIAFFALLQTTLFTRFRPFGAIPDLMLPLVIAISMTEHERWGAICGICAAFVIESLGGESLTLLPLLYMPCGYLCGILTVHYFRDSIAVRAMYTLGSSLLRGVFTAIIALSTLGGISIVALFSEALIPEFFANVIFAVLPHFIVKLCLRPFNKTREERTR